MEPRESVRDYLRGRLRLPGLTGFLVLAALYPLGSQAIFSAAFLALCAVAATLVLPSPRWLVHLAIGLALLVLTSTYLFEISNGPQDPRSDRDEAVEISVRALMAGQNPWRQSTQTGSPITSGPASVLFALPFVLVFERINELTLLFYAAFFTLLALGDLRCRNESFPVLSLLYIAGVFGFQHTLYFSLDEMYYGLVLVAAAWLLLRRGWHVLAGVALGLAVGVRLSYVFPLLGLVGWYAYGGRATPGAWVRLSLGALTGGVLVVLPFLAVLGADFVASNPLTVGGQLLADTWPDTNPLFRALNGLFGPLGSLARGALKTIASLAVLWVFSRKLAACETSHPFWHVTLGAFLTGMMVYYVPYLDYLPFFVFPAFLAIAYSETPFGFVAAGRAR